MSGFDTINVMDAPRLSIVVPAYNEEDAIDDILRRCLAARAPLIKEAGLSGVEIIVVDDGSRDATREKAKKWPEARLVIHEKNRGYGAALMTGFRAAGGDLLAFLDADGTCDPLAFAGLIKALNASKADMAVGARLHAGSKMPAVRALGNRFYAALLNSLTGVGVTDTASGMRVFKSSMLPRLAPLPTGLHFTPAMTARAACMGAKVVESPIPYEDRVGESKLSVVADGMRFLRVILGTVFAYFPLRVFGPLGALCALISAAYGAMPLKLFLSGGAFEEWMIYRLLTVLTLAGCAAVFLSFGLVAQAASDAAVGRPRSRLLDPRARQAAAAAGIALWLLGPLLNLGALLEYAATAHITSHWSRIFVGAVTVLCGTVLVSFAIALGCLAHLPGAEERS